MINAGAIACLHAFLNLILEFGGLTIEFTVYAAEFFGDLGIDRMGGLQARELSEQICAALEQIGLEVRQPRIDQYRFLDGSRFDIGFPVALKCLELGFRLEALVAGLGMR